MRTDVSIFSVPTGASVTPKKCTPGNKNNIKSLQISPQRKDPIPNQDTKILGTKKDQSIPP